MVVMIDDLLVAGIFVFFVVLNLGLMFWVLPHIKSDKWRAFVFIIMVAVSSVVIVLLLDMCVEYGWVDSSGSNLSSVSLSYLLC